MFVASTNTVPVSIFTLPDIVCNVPLIVTLPVKVVTPATPKVPPTFAFPCMFAVRLISVAPVTLKATSGAVLLIPTLLFVASTNKTPESMLTLPAIVCNVPFNVALPVNVVLPATPKVPPTFAFPCTFAVALTSISPVSLRATPGAVLLMPTLLLVASTNKTPESKLVLPAIVCNVPFNVALLVNVVLPATDREFERAVAPSTLSARSVSIVVVVNTVFTDVLPIETLLVIYNTLEIELLPPLKPKVVLPSTVKEFAVKIPFTVAFPVVVPPFVLAAVVTIVVE